MMLNALAILLAVDGARPLVASYTELCFDMDAEGNSWNARTNCKICMHKRDAGLDPVCVKGVDVHRKVRRRVGGEQRRFSQRVSQNWMQCFTISPWSAGQKQTIGNHWVKISTDCGDGMWIDAMVITDHMAYTERYPGNGDTWTTEETEWFTKMSPYQLMWYGRLNTAGYCLSTDSNDYKHFENNGLKVPAQKCYSSFWLSPHKGSVYARRLGEEDASTPMELRLMGEDHAGPILFADEPLGETDDMFFADQEMDSDEEIPISRDQLDY